MNPSKLFWESGVNEDEFDRHIKISLRWHNKPECNDEAIKSVTKVV